MNRQEFDPGRRAFLGKLGLGVAVGGLWWLRSDVGVRDQRIEDRGRDEDPIVEWLKEHFEGMALRAEKTQVEVFRLEWWKDRWYETNDWEPRWAYGRRWEQISGMQFNVVGIESSFVPAVVQGDWDLHILKGYVPNLTGDPSRWRVEIGRYYPQLNRFRWMCRPAWGEGLEHYPGLEVSYGAWAFRTWYPNKIHNILKALNDFRKRAIEGIGPGERFSFLEETGIYENLRDIDYYLMGFNSQGELVPGGGVCGFCSPLVAKTVYLAQRQGWMKIERSKPHSVGQYFINREDIDTIDATANVDYVRGSTDFVAKNVSDRRLWMVPSVQVLMEEDFPKGYRLANSLRKPSQNSRERWEEGITFVGTMVLTDREPKLEESDSVQTALDRVMERQARFGTGARGGFNQSRRG